MEVLNNPEIKAAVRQEQVRDRLGSQLAERLLSIKTWSDMNKVERSLCLKHLVSQVESEEELRERLRTDFGIIHASISWRKPADDNRVGQEALMLTLAFGGLVSKNHAMVMVKTTLD